MGSPRWLAPRDGGYHADSEPAVRPEPPTTPATVAGLRAQREREVLKYEAEHPSTNPFEKVAQAQGWNDRTRLAVLHAFIDQSDQAAELAEFAAEIALIENETEDDESSEEAADRG